MSSTGTENYSRIMLTLIKGGTKLTRRLVEKRVKDLSKNGGNDTIDEFLLKNKSLILQQKLGKNKQDVFFPPSGHTNLDYWDLCMFCFILEETCDLSNTTKKRIKKLFKMRNKLCHINDPTLERIKFEEYTDQLKRIFENCLEEINDDTFTKEINALVQSLATGPLSIDDTLKAVHKLYNLEWTHREKLEKIENGQDLTNGRLDTLIEEVRGLNSRLSSGASVDILGMGLVIEVKNCSAEKKKEVLDILEKNFNEAIEQKVSSLEEDLPSNVRQTLKETVSQVFREFFKMGRHITSVEQKCLILTIKCTSVKSFVNMIRDYRTGDLTIQLSGIETAIKNLPGCSNVQLDNLIFKEEFMEVMDDLVSKLYERVQHTEYTAVRTRSNAENSIRVTFKNPTDSDRETMQNRFETKMFVGGMKRIESELRRKLNIESMSLTTKLVKDDTVSNFEQSDTSVLDEYATVEEETQTSQSRKKAALCEEENTSTSSLRRDPQFFSDKSSHIFQGPVLTARGKETRISFDDNRGDKQIIKHKIVTHQLWTEMEDETETRQPRRKEALCEEEYASTPILRRTSQLISDKSTHLFQGPAVKARDKETRISFDEKKGDMQIIKKTRSLPKKLQELSRNINDPSTKTEINKLNQKAEDVCKCVTNAFTVTGSDVLKEKKNISRVPCPSRVDIDRFSQRLLAFKGDLRTCTSEIVSLKSNIHNFIGVNRCTIKSKESEIKAATIEVDMLDTQIQLTKEEISKYVDEAKIKDRCAVDLDNRAHYLRRRSEELGPFLGAVANTVEVLFKPFTLDASLKTGLIEAGASTAINFNDVDECKRTATSLRVSAHATNELAHRKRQSKSEYESDKCEKTIEIQNSKAKIVHLAKTCDGLASLEGLFTECILGFERAILIVQDFENEVHQTLLQGDSFQLIKEVFQEYPKEYHDETDEQMHKLKFKWIQLEQIFLVNNDRHGITF